MSPSAARLAEKLETLTPEQIATVDVFVDSLLTHQQEFALARSASAASEASFAAIWNNPEDDAYDAL